LDKGSVMAKLNKCPQCGHTELGDRWSSKGRRLLEQHCEGIDEDEELPKGQYRNEFYHNWGRWVRVCNWVGEARTPEVLKIVRSSSDMFNKAGCYEIFDRFGHAMCLSRGFGTKKDAMPEIQRELKRGVTDPDAGPYKALWWSSAGAYDRGTFVELEP
jgi:hypothetical protein